MADSLVSSALNAKAGLSCTTYARVLDAASSALRHYLAIEHPRHPEAVAAVQSGRLGEARTMYAANVTSLRPRDAIDELNEAALLALATASFSDAAHYFGEAADLAPASSAQRQDYEMQRAEALASSGEFYGEPTALNDAVAIYRRLSIAIGRNDERWPPLQADLANAVSTLATQTTTPSEHVAMLENAVALYRSVSTVRQALPTPQAWARTQYNLGLALNELGARREGANGLNEFREAKTAFQNALSVYTPDHSPRFWAQAETGLAITSMLLSVLDQDPSLRRSDVSGAIASLQRVVASRTREIAPFEWATAQSNLARAYEELAKLTQNPTEVLTLLRQTISGYRLSLEVLSAEQNGVDWATTQYDLGEALLMVAARDPSAASPQDAINAFQASQRIYTREVDGHRWGRANVSIALAHALGAERGDPSHLPLARAAMREALSAFEATGAASDAQFARQFLQHYGAQ